MRVVLDKSVIMDGRGSDRHNNRKRQYKSGCQKRHEKKEKDEKAKKAAHETKSLQMFFKPNKIAKASESNAPTSAFLFMNQMQYQISKYHD